MNHNVCIHEVKFVPYNNLIQSGGIRKNKNIVRTNNYANIGTEIPVSNVTIQNWAFWTIYSTDSDAEDKVNIPSTYLLSLVI